MGWLAHQCICGDAQRHQIKNAQRRELLNIALRGPAALAAPVWAVDILCHRVALCRKNPADIPTIAASVPNVFAIPDPEAGRLAINLASGRIWRTMAK